MKQRKRIDIEEEWRKSVAAKAAAAA